VPKPRVPTPQYEIEQRVTGGVNCAELVDPAPPPAGAVGLEEARRRELRTQPTEPLDDPVAAVEKDLRLGAGTVATPREPERKPAIRGAAPTQS